MWRRRIAAADGGVLVIICLPSGPVGVGGTGPRGALAATELSPDLFIHFCQILERQSRVYAATTTHCRCSMMMLLLHEPWSPRLAGWLLLNRRTLLLLLLEQRGSRPGRVRERGRDRKRGRGSKGGREGGRKRERRGGENRQTQGSQERVDLLALLFFLFLFLFPLLALSGIRSAE